MLRLLLLFILLYTFWNVSLGSWLFIFICSIFNIYIILTYFAFKPKLKLDNNKYSSEEILVTNRYSTFFSYPFISKSFAAVAAGVYIFGLILIAWLLLNAYWIRALIMLCNVIVAIFIRHTLDPIYSLHQAVHKRNKNEFLEEMNILDSIAEKMYPYNKEAPDFNKQTEKAPDHPISVSEDILISDYKKDILLNSKRFRDLSVIAIRDPEMEGIEIAKKIVDSSATPLKASEIVAIIRIAKEVVDTAFQCSVILEPYIPDNESSKITKILILEEFIYFFLHYFSRLAYEMGTTNRHDLISDVASWVFYSTVERIWEPISDEQKDQLIDGLYKKFSEKEEAYANCKHLISKIADPDKLRKEMLLSDGAINQLLIHLISIVFDRIIEDTGHDALFSKKIGYSILDVWIQKNENWKDLIRRSTSQISFA